MALVYSISCCEHWTNVNFSYVLRLDFLAHYVFCPASQGKVGGIWGGISQVGVGLVSVLSAAPMLMLLCYMPVLSVGMCRAASTIQIKSRTH